MSILNFPVITFTRLNGETIKIKPFSNKAFKDLSTAYVTGYISEDNLLPILDFIQGNIIESAAPVTELPFYDVIQLFIKLRAISVNEVLELSYTCENIVNGDKCGNNILVGVDITEADYTNKFNGLLVLDNTDTNYTALTINPPTFKNWVDLQDDKNVIPVIASLIKNVIYLNDVNEYSEDEYINSLNELPPNVFILITNWIKMLPSVYLTFDLVCNKCKHKERVTVNGIKHFFGL